VRQDEVQKRLLLAIEVLTDSDFRPTSAFFTRERRQSVPEVEITTTELAKKSRKDLGRCHRKEIEFRTHATNGFRLASSLKAMPQQSNTS